MACSDAQEGATGRGRDWLRNASVVSCTNAYAYNNNAAAAATAKGAEHGLSACVCVCINRASVFLARIFVAVYITRANVKWQKSAVWGRDERKNTGRQAGSDVWGLSLLIKIKQ